MRKRLEIVVSARSGTQGFPGSLCARRKGKYGYGHRLNPEGRRLNRLLARAQELAEQVRETAERVHQQAREARRLTGIARQQAERGTRSGRLVKWSVDSASNGKRRQSRRNET